jgi:DNA adenine methylase
MKIAALAPWFGGKRTLAPVIVEELGPHRAYWEPFCGSMAVLMGKPSSSMETVNDLHGDLINLARVIQATATGSELYRRLRRAWMDEATYDTAQTVIRTSFESETPDVDRAFNYFVASWLGRNGTSGINGVGKAFCVRYTKNGGHAATRFASCIESIPAWRRRMRGVTILRRDGIELIERIEDAANVAIYADPPYLVKGAKYQHDFDWLAHRRLATALKRFTKTRVVVSYYDHPDLAALYPGWTVRRCTIAKAMAHQGARGENTATAPEVLLINGPSLAREAVPA